MGLFKKIFGLSKLDIEILIHFKQHGKFHDPEVLAHCPICNEDHRVFYFRCNCGDVFFCHLNKESNNYDLFPTGKWTKGGAMFEL